jgi:hypothetical protein
MNSLNFSCCVQDEERTTALASSAIALRSATSASTAERVRAEETREAEVAALIAHARSNSRLADQLVCSY